MVDNMIALANDGSPLSSFVLPIAPYLYSTPTSESSSYADDDLLDCVSEIGPDFNVPFNIPEDSADVGLVDGYPMLRGILDAVRVSRCSRATAMRKGAQFVQALDGNDVKEKDQIMEGFMSLLDKMTTKKETNEKQLENANSRPLKRKRLGGQDEETERQIQSYERRGEGVRESELPWYDARKYAQLSDSMKETRKTLEYISADVETVKRWVRSAIDAPPTFPPSEWEAILTGEYVNLDVVFSTLFFAQSTRDDRDSRTYYLVESGRIETASDWMYAFQQTIDATMLVFPHRKEEMEEYRRRIGMLFTSYGEEVHDHILAYDEAIRRKVRGGQVLSLLDERQFRGIYDAIFLPEGIYYDEIRKHAISTRR